LRFELDKGQQRTISHDYQVPILLGTIEAGQLLLIFPEDVSLR
jgi:hypothetical protein